MKLTSGFVDRVPRWSPNGQWIAFTSNRDSTLRRNGHAARNLFLLNPDDPREIRQLTRLNADVSNDIAYPIVRSLTWWPDSTRLCCWIRPSHASNARAAHIYDRMKYKMAEEGWFDGVRRHLWMISIDGDSQQLTNGDWDDYCPVVSPDGHSVAFVSARFADDQQNTMADPNPFTRQDIWLLDLNRELPPVKLTQSDGPCLSPSFSPDGRWIAYFGHRDPTASWSKVHLLLISAEGGEPRDLLEDWDYPCGSFVMSDIHEVLAPTAAWTADSETISFLATVRGAANLYSVSIHGGPPVNLTEGDHEVVEASFDAAGTTFAALVSDEHGPPDVFSGSPRGILRRVTNLNSDVLATRYTSEAERIEFTGADGWSIEGFYLKPPDFDPQRKYPLVLEILPGAQFAHGKSFNHEYQVLAGLGYIVLHVNPRGAGSYGHLFARHGGNKPVWFGKDFDDLMAGVDYLIGLGFVDAERLGVTGDAGGGAMTNWIITQTTRFKASVARRSMSNLLSYTTDRAGTSPLLVAGLDMYSDPAPYLRQSPVMFVHNVTTPHCLIHSAGDLRLPISQAEEFFIALKSLGKTARLIVFENDVHFLSRDGTPNQRAEFFEHIVSWLGRFLAPEQTIE